MWSGEATAGEWMTKFRMPKEEADALADELSPNICPDPSSPRVGLSVEKELTHTLPFLKDTGSVAVSANAFRFSAPTVSKTIRDVCCTVTLIWDPGIKRYHVDMSSKNH